MVKVYLRKSVKNYRQ